MHTNQHSLPSACAPSVAPVGIGLRHAHYAEVLQTLPELAFLEVHSENFFAPGGAARKVLREAREHYAISLHGVSLALGSAIGVDPAHLDALALLAADVEPVRVSDHLCFARVAGIAGQDLLHASDLLPAALTAQSLDIFCRNIDLVQSRLKRGILIENLSSYVRWRDNSYDEPGFLNALCERAGCKLLVDVNNVVVNALNDRHERDDAAAAACEWLDRIDARHVAEMHLAGYAIQDGWAIDDHGSRVHAPVWRAFAHAARRFGQVATCIEWDTAVPALQVLLDEAATAAVTMQDATQPQEALCV